MSLSMPPAKIPADTSHRRTNYSQIRPLNHKYFYAKFNSKLSFNVKLALFISQLKINWYKIELSISNKISCI